MDDMHAFEREVAAAFAHRAGPPRQVDAAAIFAGVGVRRSQGWGFGSLYSVSRLLVAGLVVALFGGVLLQGIVLAPQEDRRVDPAVASASPSAEATEAPAPSAFPTGTFVSDGSDTTLVFRPDGTCDRSGTACTFGVDGRLFVEMTFEDPSVAQVPAAYFWDFDGEQLTFELRGEELQPSRLDTYTNHAYRPVGETMPLPAAGTDFPIGAFDWGATGPHATLWFNESGYQSDTTGGWYIVNGDLVTFSTDSSSRAHSPRAMPPATYHWAWDGERLTFRLWGEDNDPWRSGQMAGRVFVRVDDDYIVLGDVRRLLLSSPRLEYFVTVEIQERDDGRFVATASIDDEPLGEGIGDTQQEATRAALEPLGEPHASDLAEKVTG